MRVGIKLWSRNDKRHFDEAGFADFIEVMPVDMQSALKVAKRKGCYTVHIPHEGFGFDPLRNYALSEKLLNLALEAGGKLNAECYIMHTGMLEQKPDEETRQKALKSIARLAKSANTDKIVIENSGYRSLFNGEPTYNHLCYSPDELKEILELSGAGFCLDFEHASITAAALGTSYERIIDGLMKLKPDYFQISGTRHSTGERHLSIFEGDLELDIAKRELKKADKPVCLETPLDTGQRKREVEFLKK
ncbi:TPA: TIM barrel protein [Candidatus Woesearchaeota archaeon]|nr:TIM barrel protein [Candidatus Woesearchaeota archaeon]